MSYRVHTFPLSDAGRMYEALLLLSEQESYFQLLDSNNYPKYPYSKYQWLCAVGAYQTVELDTYFKDFWQDWEAFVKASPWCFGFMAYDVKNCIEENLTSSGKDVTESPLLFFFHPELVATNDGVQLLVHERNEEKFQLLCALMNENIHAENYTQKIELQPLVSKEEYVLAVDNIRAHILRGDVYEMNYCIEWQAKAQVVQKAGLYKAINDATQAPFSVFGKWRQITLCCASPERFLCKRNEKLISQPIKGTRKVKLTPELDHNTQKQLLESEKERSENVMIADLVRNDMSVIAEKGSVEVEELAELYSFRTVHQLITTVKCKIKNGVSLSDIFKALYPMGSMTGAPKISAMQLAERHEPMKRGLFSGSVGYFSPDGDFDFNVVIRSVIINDATNAVVVRAGSAITYEADSSQEYEECRYKADVLLRILSGNAD